MNGDADVLAVGMAHDMMASAHPLDGPAMLGKSLDEVLAR
jgi:hypothetical protein